MCLQNLILIDDVDVQQGVALLKQRADQADHFIHGLRAVCKPRINFELEGCGVAVARLDRRDGIGDRRDRAVLAEAGMRVRPVADCLAVVPAVRRRADIAAEFQRVRPAEPAGDKADFEVKPALLPHHVRERFADALCPGVARRIAAAVALAVHHHLADVFPVKVGVVELHVARQILKGDFVFFLDALLARGKAIRHGGQPRAVDAHVEIPRTLRNVAALFHGAVAEQVADQLRLVFLLILQVEQDALRGNGDRLA